MSRFWRDASLERWRKGIIIAVPSIWLLVFLLLPFLYVLKISLAESILAQPPFTDLVTFDKATLHIALHLGNYLRLVAASGFWVALLSSIQLAFSATVLCILIGYPIAYALSQCSPNLRGLLFLIIILPYWTSFLLRAYAWINILQNNGIINQFLMWTGITHSPIRLIYNNFSVYLGIVYGYLPYFILPTYATLIKLDKRLLEAASDLGARAWQRFFKVTLPLSMPGVLAGALLVFIPAMGEVVIPEILGGLHTLLIGNIIWQQFFTANNWCVAAALSVVMLIILVLPIVWLQRIERRREDQAS